MRSAYVRLGASLVEDPPSREATYTTTEVADAIEAATADVQKQFLSTYVARKKVDMSTFNVYLQTVRDVIESEYVYDTSLLSFRYHGHARAPPFRAGVPAPPSEQNRIHGEDGTRPPCGISHAQRVRELAHRSLIRRFGPFPPHERGHTGSARTLMQPPLTQLPLTKWGSTRS